jgi:hypothetical protein
VTHDGNDREQPGHTFVITSHDHTIARDIAQVVVHRGWDLHELRPITMGLEELFVRLTAEEARAAA